jgi:hypothetical protein
MDTDTKSRRVDRASDPCSTVSVRGCIAGITLLLVLLLLGGAATAEAHPPMATVALVKVEHGGRVTLTLSHDSLAFALGDTSVAIGDEAMYGLLHGPDGDLAAAYQDGRERFSRQLQMFVDGGSLALQLVDSPTLEKARQWQLENVSERLPLKLEFVVSAELPAGAHSMAITFPQILDQVVMSVERPGLEPLIVPVSPGEKSPAIDIGMATGAAAPGEKPKDEGTLAVGWRFTKLGFEHIVGPSGGRWWLPQGLDHCLFVLGLFLLIPRFKPVLWQISSFTLAHTLTLTLTSLHIIGLSGRIVEPTIAATIAFIGIENLVVTKVSPWRIAVAFCFGLVHGMGVATAFNEAGFPPGQLVTSLAAFTVGVEGGHIAMLVVAFLALGWFRDKHWYRKRLAIPLSILIALVALFWVVQRIVAAA